MDPEANLLRWQGDRLVDISCREVCCVLFFDFVALLRCCCYHHHQFSIGGIYSCISWVSK